MRHLWSVWLHRHRPWRWAASGAHTNKRASDDTALLLPPAARHRSPIPFERAPTTNFAAQTKSRPPRIVQSRSNRGGCGRRGHKHVVGTMKGKGGGKSIQQVAASNGQQTSPRAAKQPRTKSNNGSIRASEFGVSKPISETIVIKRLMRTRNLILYLLLCWLHFP